MSELVVLVGLPGSGKTSFYQAHFASTHVQVSKDLMKNARDRQERQIALIDRALAAGRSVVVDNVNAHPGDRAPLLLAGRARQARVVAYYLDTDVRESLARNRARAGKARVPDVALFVARKRLVPPTPAEGFDAVFHVRSASGTFEVTPSP